jgi:CBS domain containing-hemolysin-like protein
MLFGLPWWGLTVLIVFLLVCAVIFRLGVHRLGPDSRSVLPGTKTEDNNSSRQLVHSATALRRSQIALLLSSRIAAFSGFALILIGPAARYLSSPLEWVLVIILLAIALAMGSLLVDGLSRSRQPEDAPTNASKCWYRLGQVLSILLFPIHRLLEVVMARIGNSESNLADRWRQIPDEPELEVGVLEEHEAQLGDYIAEFRDTDVEEVMTSRMDIVAIPTSATLQGAVDIISESGHSRLPLFRDHLDHIEGMIYAKDLLKELVGGDPDAIPNWPLIARKPLLVSTDQSIEDLLRAFKMGTTHVALVIDEYGGTEGLVTLEDVLEELVGDIRDEFDQDQPVLFERIDERHIRFDARIDLDAFGIIVGSYLDIDISQMLETEQLDFETLGGLVQHLTESIPDSGIEVSASGLVFRVEDVDQHRIGHVVVSPAEPSRPPETAEQEEAD